jgi:hypothetical protein
MMKKNYIKPEITAIERIVVPAMICTSPTIPMSGNQDDDDDLWNPSEAD